MVVGDNGILAKAQTAKERTNKTQQEELDQLSDFEEQIDTLGRAGSANSNYSTDEKKIGTWINGKPIYSKVMDLGYSFSISKVAHAFSMRIWLESCKHTAVAVQI